MSENSVAGHLAPRPVQPVQPPGSSQGSQPDRLAWGALLALGILAALSLGRDLLVPVALAAFLALLLSPAVKGLRRMGLPEWLGAAITVAALVGSLGMAVAATSAPAMDWNRKIPVLVRELEMKFDDLRGSVERAREAIRTLEEVANGPREERATVAVRQNTGLIPVEAERAVAGIVVTLALMFFMLAGGRRTFEALLATLPSIERRLYWSDIANTIQRRLPGYLITITGINIVLGAITTAMLWAFGMPSPLLWGLIAGILNYVPYIGPLVTTLVLFAVSLMTFDDWVRVLLPPLLFQAMQLVEGEVITPTIVGRQLSLNPIAVALSIMFWGWMWGIVGALLAVPILIALKIVLSADRRFAVLGAIINGDEREARSGSEP